VQARVKPSLGLVNLEFDLVTGLERGAGLGKCADVLDHPVLPVCSNFVHSELHARC
jgi:hypothetical protein